MLMYLQWTNCILRRNSE